MNLGTTGLSDGIYLGLRRPKHEAEEFCFWDRTPRHQDRTLHNQGSKYLNYYKILSEHSPYLVPKAVGV
jgi:hypothetical protein